MQRILDADPDHHDCEQRDHRGEHQIGMISDKSVHVFAPLYVKSHDRAGARKI
jgi:hypothetical protein